MTDKERETWQKEQALRAAERIVDMERLPQGSSSDVQEYQGVKRHFTANGRH